MKIVCKGPYDLTLSWRMMSAFAGRTASPQGRLALWWEENPTVLQLRQPGRDPPTVEARADPHPEDAAGLADLLGGILNADLELSPFYSRALDHRALAGVVKDLEGLKPLRPPDLFQMLITALTEQQISMAAAARIRERIVDAYGKPAGDLMVFPRPRDLASGSIDELRRLGLSRRKAEYLLDLARNMAVGGIDTTSWEAESDEVLIGELISHRGIGEWTAEYVLARGLGRLDVVPASDLGVRRAVGHYLGRGGDPSPDEVRDMLCPWSPWRGLLAFYIMAHYRITQMGLDQA